MSKTFRKAAMSTICMLIVAVMSLTGATYAWFTSGTEAMVEGIDMKVTTAEGGIVISKDAIQWANNIDLADTVDKSNMAPVSTVNAKQFYTAVLSTENNEYIATKAATDANYIKAVLYLKNDGDAEFQADLGTTTSAIKDEAVNARKGHLATRLAVHYSAPLATFTNGVAATTEQILALEANTKAFIYEPHSTTHLVEGDTAVKEYKGVQAATYTGEAPAADTVYFHVNTGMTLAETPVATENLAAVSTEKETTSCVITVPAKSIIAVEVYIWIEGQDVDCINDIATSQLAVALNFKKHVN